MNKKNKYEQKLIFATKQGCKNSFQTLIEMHKSQILSKIVVLSGNEYDANDILQETYIKAYTKIDLYQKNTSFAAWLYTIARNIFIDNIRKNALNTTVEINDFNQTEINDTEEEQWVKKEDDITNLENAIKHLPKEYRDVLNMYFFLDMSYINISEKMNVPIGTIKTWIHRAKKELQETILNKKNGN